MEHEKEFKYIEFIRNPRRDREKEKEIVQDLEWVALDYFDYIYIKDVERFSDCMDSQSDIPCEAYQSIGIFNEKKQNDKIQVIGESEEEKQERPFLAVLQVTIMPDVYKEENEELYKSAKKELEDLVKDASGEFDKAYKMHYKVYYTVNNVDFCILISSDRLDIAGYISNKIKQILTGGKKPKYSVYTTIGIYCKFKSNGRTCMEEDTVLITRVSLDRMFYSQKVVKVFLDNLEKHTGSDVKTNTHILPGKYELSIRIDGRTNVLETLEYIIKFNYAWLRFEEKNLSGSITDIVEEEKKNAVCFLIKNNCIKYINARILYSGKKMLHNIGSEEPYCEEDTSEEYNNIKKLHKELKEKLSDETDNYIRMILEEYLNKLNRIVHTYGALLNNNDTKVSMRMLTGYLKSYLQLLLLNAGFLESGYIAQKNYAQNFLAGINYLQRYMTIITSVNEGSFEAPRFGTERDECSIVKLPVAYSEFLNEVFNQYYEQRKDKDKRDSDDEINYFPRYYPLVIPFVKDGTSDFMMMSLFAQNLSDDWEKIKGDWEKHIRDNKEILLFIICQDINKYKDVSALLVASFHELGHYCNRITRKERNSDLIKIFSQEIACRIVKRLIGSTEIGYMVMLTLEIESAIIAELQKAVYDALISYFMEQLDLYMDYPECVFKERFKANMEQLFDCYLNCNDNILKNIYDDNISYTAKYEFGIESREDSVKAYTQALFSDIQAKSKETLSLLKEDLENLLNGRESKLFKPCREGLYSEAAKGKINEILSYVKKIITIWEDISIDNLSADESIEDKISEINQGVDIGNFLKNEYPDKENFKQQIQFFSKIRQVLYDSNQSLMFGLKLCDKLVTDEMAYVEMKRRNGQDGESTKEYVKKYVEPKKKFIREVCSNYIKNTKDRFGTMTMESDRNYEIYYKMHITPDSGFVSEFERILNQGMLGLSISGSQLDLYGSCYRESLADIIMCANLDLGAKEYLAVVKHFFDFKYEPDAKWKAARLVIVLSYLWFPDSEKRAKKDIDKDVLIIEFHDRIQRLREGLSADCSQILEIVDFIKRKSEIVIYSRLYDVTMKRVNELKPHFKFLGENEKEQITFIHRDLEEKLKNNFEKKENVQADEIRFVLNYYYKNRKKYASEPDGKEKDKNGKRS